ncbi:MAG: hypothetical protein K2J04_10325 [Lachnospiraceae bacterium]|nr:hypothetical protein [Lachnospiraceae bacterium]
MEMTILPAGEQEKSSKKSVDIDQALQSLIGAIPYSDMSFRRIERGTPKEV